MKHFQNKSLFNKWLEFSTDDGKEIRVEFKDGGFKHIYEKSGSEELMNKLFGENNGN